MKLFGGASLDASCEAVVAHIPDVTHGACERKRHSGRVLEKTFNRMDDYKDLVRDLKTPLEASDMGFKPLRLPAGKPSSSPIP